MLYLTKFKKSLHCTPFRSPQSPPAPARRRRGATAWNTADAETASLDEATHSSGMVIQEIFEQMLERPMRLIAEEDNSANISAVKRGYSRRLCYLRRTQRLSLSALHECFFGAEEQEELGEASARDTALEEAQGDDSLMERLPWGAWRVIDEAAPTF